MPEKKDSIRKLRKEKKADVSVLDYSLPYNYADRHSGWICHGSADEYFLWDYFLELILILMFVFYYLFWQQI